MKDLIALLRKKTTPLFHWIIDYALQLTEIGKQKRTEVNTPAPRNREIMTGNIRDRSLFIAWGGSEYLGGDHMVF